MWDDCDPLSDRSAVPSNHLSRVDSTSAPDNGHRALDVPALRGACAHYDGTSLDLALPARACSSWPSRVGSVWPLRVRTSRRAGLWCGTRHRPGTPCWTRPCNAARSDRARSRRTPCPGLPRDCGWTCSTKLAERSILRGEKDRILGIFPTTRWPAADSRHEGEIREGHWAAEAVGAAIQAVQTAVSAAVMTAAITVVGRLERRLTGLLKRMPPAQAGKAAVVAVGGDPLAP